MLVPRKENKRILQRHGAYAVPRKTLCAWRTGRDGGGELHPPAIGWAPYGPGGEEEDADCIPISFPHERYHGPQVLAVLLCEQEGECEGPERKRRADASWKMAQGTNQPNQQGGGTEAALWTRRGPPGIPGTADGQGAQGAHQRARAAEG
jgi:hypothetical protein